MTRKYLAFDLETAKDVPGEVFDWRPHRPLGISCAAALPSDATAPVLWHGRTADGQPAPRMSREEAASLVRDLERFVAEGYTLVTWNGLGFDLDILAEEADELAACRRLAREHVDLMFHVFCEKGFPVALDKAAQGLRVPGKPAGMAGWLAPRRWAEGQHQEVLDYVGQDVRIALAVAQRSEERRRFEWITAKGKASSFPLPRGWLRVQEALRLPEPDVSWMTNPLRRSEFTRWLGKG